MKKYLLPLCLSLGLTVAYGQTPAGNDYRKGATSTAKKTGWKRLVRRFEKADSTLTLEDYKRVYYGSALRKEYNPYAPALELAKELYETGMFGEALLVCNEGLRSTPASLTLLRIRAWAGGEYGLPPEQQVVDLVKHGIVLSAIVSEGDGKSEATAFRVICIDDEYELMRFRGVPAYDRQTLETGDGKYYDRIEYETQDGKKETLYFDITLPVVYLMETNRTKSEQ